MNRHKSVHTLCNACHRQTLYREIIPLDVNFRCIRGLLGGFGLWAGRYLYRVTPAVIRGMFFWSHPKDRTTGI